MNPFERSARMRLDASAFEGTSSGRLFRDWAGATATAPDLEMAYELRPLRSRARDLVRNNDYMAGLVESIADNVVGWGPGLTLRSMVETGDPDSSREVQREIERGWKEWGHKETASVGGRSPWGEVQRLAIKTWATDGEVFVRRRRGFDNAFAYAVEFLDADLLDESFSAPPGVHGPNEIRMGVEVDGHSRPVAYHFWKRHPAPLRRMGGNERVRIPADEITHFFIQYRANQTRGYTLFAPALTSVKMVDGMTLAELTASRAAAAKMGFITNNEPEAVAQYAARLARKAERGQERGSSRKIPVAPGVIEELMPGQGFESFDPNHPNTAFDDFLKTIMRGVARAFNVSYLTLTGDVSEANFSSMRAGLLPERDHFRVIQDLFAEFLPRDVFREWLPLAILTNQITLPTRDASKYMAHEWRGRRWAWVDPVKDLVAAERGVHLGINSRTEIAAQRGREYEDVIEERASEEQFAREKFVRVIGVEGAKTRPKGLAPVPVKPNANGAGNANGTGGAGSANRLAHTELFTDE